MMTIKGQVTVPKRLRDKLGLRPNRPVRFTEIEGGRVIIEPVPEADAADREAKCQDMLRRIDSVSGTGELGMSTDEFMAMIREPLEPFELEAIAQGRTLA